MTSSDAGDRPNVLICSALDPSGGAGFIADTRVVSDLGGRPIGVTTALTIQNTQGMRSCHELDAEVVGAELNAVLTDIEVHAVKLGILVTAPRSPRDQSRLTTSVESTAADLGMEVEIVRGEGDNARRREGRVHVTLLGRPLPPR